MNWSGYFEKTKGRKPADNLVRAVEELGGGEGKLALDLGCGAGRDSRYLSGHGFSVTAVDADESAGSYIGSIPKVEFVHSRYEDFQFDQYDLINASYSLPFAGERHFDTVWQNIGHALKPGGVFVGDLFGDRDDWNTGKARLVFHSLDDVQKLVDGFEVLVIDEEESEGSTAKGETKQWHVFHILLRRSTNNLPLNS